MRLFFATVLFCCITFSAEAKLYQLDLLIYKQPSQNVKHELWQQHPAEPKANSRLPEAISASPKDFFYFKKRLEAKTTVLAQGAWQFSSSSTVPISLEESTEKLWGYLTVKPGRYVDLKIDLLYELIGGFGQTSPFPFRDKRRLIPGTVYYFDHPLVGILAKVS